jgi:hypothetical protein
VIVFGGRLFSILDLPLLLPDAIGTGGGMQRVHRVSNRNSHKRHVGTSNVNGGEWKWKFHMWCIVCVV